MLSAAFSLSLSLSPFTKKTKRKLDPQRENSKLCQRETATNCKLLANKVSDNLPGQSSQYSVHIGERG